MTIDFKGKIVVVTGAGGGLGRGMVAAFHKCGAFVVACDLKAPDFSDYEERVFAKGFDITDYDATANAIAEIGKKFGKIDLLINNAGINVGPDQRKTVEHFDETWWNAIQNVDLGGVFHCSKAAIPYFPKDGGAIINISSIVGMVPLRNQCSFAAAKAGVINLTKAMAIELAEKNIRVNAVAPGSIGIAITNRLWSADEAMKGLLAHIPQGRQGTPDDIANACLFLGSELASYITGTVLPVDGGWTAGGFARNF